MSFKDPEKAKAYYAKYRELNRERKKPAYFKSMLKLQHGMTVEEYNKILVDQNFSCALCRKHMSSFKHRLAVDHCHETGRTRGLLCMGCNTSLGKLGDTIQSISNVLKYLQTQNASV